MKAPAKIAILNVITVVALSVMIFVIVLLLAQNRGLTRDVKAQTDINQRYLRCILLIPEKEFDDTNQRVKAIDKCSLESKLPNGQPVGQAPTAEQREAEANKQEAQKPTPAASSATTTQSAPQSSAPQTATSQSSPNVQTNDPEVTTSEPLNPLEQASPQANPLEQITNRKGIL